MASSNESTGQAPFSWGRTSALAVAIALHSFAFLLLVAPMAPPKSQEKQKEKVVQVDFIEPPPPAPPADIAPSENLSYRQRNPPKYPPQAVRQRHEGTVVLLVLVGVDGSPKDIKVDQSSGFRELDKAAEDAARNWKFNPGKRGGAAVEGYARVPVTFNLNQL